MPQWGVFAIESQHAPQFKMDLDVHNFYEVFFVLEGQGDLELESELYSVNSQQVVIIPAGSSHRFVENPNKPLSMLGIAVSPNLWQHDSKLPELLPVGPLSLNPINAARVKLQFRQLGFEQTMSGAASISILVGLALQLLAQLARGGAIGRVQVGANTQKVSANREAVKTYVQELERSFFERTNLDDVAARLGMSRRRFTQLFREVTGASWTQHVSKLRIAPACHLLQQTERSVERIAFECGYEELSSFYRAFRRLHQLAPSQWREQNSL